MAIYFTHINIKKDIKINGIKISNTLGFTKHQITFFIMYSVLLTESRQQNDGKPLWMTITCKLLISLDSSVVKMSSISSTSSDSLPLTFSCSCLSSGAEFGSCGVVPPS